MKLSSFTAIPKTVLQRTKNIIKTTATGATVPVIYATFGILPPKVSNKVMGFLDKFMPKKKYYLEKLSDSFYCGSEVGDKEIENIAQKGIKKIIDLKVQSKKTIKKLTILCQKYEISYLNIPINVFEKPGKVIKKLIDVVKNVTPENPVYVHCKYGEDRTGFVRGLYRILIEKRDLGEVLQEMIAKGYKPKLFKHFIEGLKDVETNMYNYCKNFYQ